MKSTNNIQKVVNKKLVLVTPMLVRLDSRASADSPFLGTGSGKVKGQSDTFLTAGSVFFVCRCGTLDCQGWYVQCSKNL